MNSRRPEIFVSATSADLRTCRSLIKDAILTLGSIPVEQTNFPPEASSVREMLRKRISQCDAVLHLAGEVYGEEPKKREPTDQRQSYTQMEYELAKELNKPVYVFVCGEGFPYDEHDPEDEDKRELQRRHRARLQSGDHLYTAVESRDELALKVHQLQTKIETLNAELKRSQSWLGRGVAVGLTLLLMLSGGLWWVSHQTQMLRDEGSVFNELVKDLDINLDDLNTDDFEVHFEEEGSGVHAFNVSVLAKSEDVSRLLRDTVGFISFDGRNYQQAWTLGKPSQVLVWTMLSIPSSKGMWIKFEPEYEKRDGLRTIGPFHFKLDARTEALKLFKQLVLDATSWGHHHGHYVQIMIREYYPAIKRLRLGFSPNSLNEVIEINGSKRQWGVQQQLNEVVNITRESTIRLSQPNTTLYLQFVFYDDTLSPVRQIKPEASTTGVVPSSVVMDPGASETIRKLVLDAESVPNLKEADVKQAEAVGIEQGGPDIIGIQLGMSFDHAISLIQEHMEVGKTLLTDRSRDVKAAIGNIRPFSSGRLYVSKDATEIIAIYDEPPAAEHIVVGVARQVLLRKEQMRPGEVFGTLRNKYGSGDVVVSGMMSADMLVWGDKHIFNWIKNAAREQDCLPVKTRNNRMQRKMWRDESGREASWGNDRLRANGGFPALDPMNFVRLDGNIPSRDYCSRAIAVLFEQGAERVQWDTLYTWLFDLKMYAKVMRKSAHLLSSR